MKKVRLQEGHDLPRVIWLRKRRIPGLVVSCPACAFSAADTCSQVLPDREKGEEVKDTLKLPSRSPLLLKVPS